MARVNVEQTALTDSRFGTLGLLLLQKEIGAAAGDVSIETAQCLGIGRMVRVWNACQERNTYTLSEIDLLVLLGHEESGQFLVDCGLGQRVKGGRIRIRGTDGRIEWLAKSRDNGSKGGEHGVKGGRPKKTPDGVSEKPPVGFVEKPPPAPTPALTPTTKEESKPSCPDLVAELRSLGIKVPAAKVEAVGKWPERFGGVAHVLGLARTHLDRISLADHPLQYLGGILRKDADGTGHRTAGGTGPSAQPARKLTQDFPHESTDDPDVRKKYGLSPLQDGPAGGPDGSVH